MPKRITDFLTNPMGTAVKGAQSMFDYLGQDRDDDKGTTQATGTYTVQPGDTLSGIARSRGIDQGSITGYRSGDPNLIYPGEKLNVGGVTDVSRQADPVQADPIQADPITQRDPVDRGMDPWTERETEGGIIESTRYEIGEAEKRRDDIMNQMENARTDLFNREYEEQGLPQTKERLNEVDSEISELRGERDEAILTAQRNPNISAGVLQGEVQRLTDYYNSLINNSIEKRNAVASDYNTALDEIGMRVQNQLGDLATEYDHWDNMVREGARRMERYEGLLRDEFARETEEDRWERQFQLELMDAMGVDPETGEPVGSDWDVARNIVRQNPDMSETGLLTRIRENTGLGVTDARNVIAEEKPTDDYETSALKWIDDQIKKGWGVEAIEKNLRDKAGLPPMGESELPEPYRSHLDQYREPSTSWWDKLKGVTPPTQGLWNRLFGGRGDDREETIVTLDPK